MEEFEDGERLDVISRGADEEQGIASDGVACCRRGKVWEMESRRAWSGMGEVEREDGRWRRRRARCGVVCMVKDEVAVYVSEGGQARSQIGIGTYVLVLVEDVEGLDGRHGCVLLCAGLSHRLHVYINCVRGRLRSLGSVMSCDPTFTCSLDMQLHTYTSWPKFTVQTWGNAPCSASQSGSYAEPSFAPEAAHLITALLHRLDRLI